MVTWCAAKFGALNTSIFQCDFKCKTSFGQIWPGKPYTWRVFLHHDLIWKKADLKRAWHFQHTKKFPSKNPHFGDTTQKHLYTGYVSLRRTDFLWKWLKMDVGESKIFWFGNNGRHMSQENVIKSWVALYPTFTGAYGILWIPEQGHASNNKWWKTFWTFYFSQGGLAVGLTFLAYCTVLLYFVISQMNTIQLDPQAKQRSPTD